MQIQLNFLKWHFVVLTLILSNTLHELCSASEERTCEFVSEGPQMCDGVPYFEQEVSTPGFCEMYRCQTDPNCGGFTFFVSENRCALYENCNKDTLVDCTESETCITGVCHEFY